MAKQVGVATLFLAFAISLFGAAQIFEVGDGTITLAKLHPDVRDQLGGGSSYTPPAGSTLFDEPDTLIAHIVWTDARETGPSEAGSSFFGGYAFDDTADESIAAFVCLPYPIGSRTNFRFEFPGALASAPSASDALRLKFVVGFKEGNWGEWLGTLDTFEETVTWDDTNANGRFGTWTVNTTAATLTSDDANDWIMKIEFHRLGSNAADTVTGDAYFGGGRVTIW